MGNRVVQQRNLAYTVDVILLPWVPQAYPAMFTTAAAQMNLRALLATLPDFDVPGADGDMAVMVKAVLAMAECPRLVAGCPDALIGGPLVTPGC
jgi:hypothetical protein